MKLDIEMEKKLNKRIIILLVLLLINVVGFVAASYYFSSFPIHGSIVDFESNNQNQPGAQISHIGKFVQFALEIVREAGQ